MTEFTPISAGIGGLLIGLAAVLLMAATGRVAGVSGFVSRLLPPYEDQHLLVRLAFVSGLVAAPAAFALFTGTPIEMTVTSNIGLLVPAGLLVGIGSVTASGCTSGHGVCGVARLSPRSLTATTVFMSMAMLTVFVSRHLFGGL
jgi:uncharacterized membrane protein YedE/YeeE